MNNYKASLTGLLLCLLFQPLLACDICGSYVGNMRVGLLNQVNSNFINIGYGYTTFDGTGLSYDKDVFQSATISFQSWYKNWGFYVDQRYAWNHRHTSKEVSGFSGFANSNVSVFYKVLNKSYESSNLTCRLGLSAKLPTGRFLENTHEESLPESFSPSDGAWGYGVSADLIYSMMNNGLIWNADYNHSFEDPNGLRPGDSWINQVRYYHQLNAGRWTWMPYGGLSHEFVKNNVYPSGLEADDTGGNALFLSSGVNVDLGSTNVSLNAMWPLASNYGGGDIDASPRFQFQTTYLFN